MTQYSFPTWDRDLQERVNATGGAGMPGIVQNFDVFNRGGVLVGRRAFLDDLRALVERHEALALQAASATARLATLHVPKLHKEGWRKALHEWMKVVLEAFLGFAVEVPPPPAFDRRQRRVLTKYGFRLFFVPAITEAQYPAHIVRPAWRQFLNEASIERFPLPGKWVAMETIRRPDCTDCAYPDDLLMKDIGIASRFAHPYSGLGEGDDIVEDYLPKIATTLHLPPTFLQLPTMEVWNFLGNLFNWLNANTADALFDLGSTDSGEWCANRYSSDRRLVVGVRGTGGLAGAMTNNWHDSRYNGVGFRVLVELPPAHVLPAAA